MYQICIAVAVALGVVHFAGIVDIGLTTIFSIALTPLIVDWLHNYFLGR